MKRNHSHFSSNQGRVWLRVRIVAVLRAVALASAMACLAWSALAVLPTAHAQSASSQTAMSTSRSLSLPAQPLGQALNALARTWGCRFGRRPWWKAARRRRCKAFRP
jgi:outer membrane receptor for ferric coprogen and ferric-rhodotorulic acid